MRSSAGHVVLALGAALALLAVHPPGMVSADEGTEPGSGRSVGEIDPAQVLESPVTPAEVSVDDSLRKLQWYLDRIRVPAAWSVTRGDPEVTIAVVDTGVDPDHLDLRGAFWTDPVSGQNGFDHSEGGFPTYRGAIADWHGTAVAGVVAARADDAYGIAGVAPEASIMVRRIYGSVDESTPPTQSSYRAAIEAIDASVAAGADVILLTWGGLVNDPALERAIRRAGVPVVAAAGNDGIDMTLYPAARRYPAAYQLPNLVTVAASDRDNRIAANPRVTSNFGARHVDIAAPGVDIVSVRAGADHGVFDGTSFAAPQVAAALALGRSVSPRAPTNDLVGALLSSARRVAPLRDAVQTGGILDVAAFLAALERPICDDTYPPNTFTDVSRESVHLPGINCVTWYEVALGTGDDRFQPSRTLTRGEMATFLARVLERAGYEPPAAEPDGDGTEPEPTFTDIAGTTHEAAIEVIAAAGVAGGVGDARFAPRDTVTRAQMATFLVNTVAVLTQRELVAEQVWFDDIDGSIHAGSINLVRELGITLGTSEPRRYDPTAGLTRAQMATFLANTLDLLGREGLSITRPS